MRPRSADHRGHARPQHQPGDERAFQCPRPSPTAHHSSPLVPAGSGRHAARGTHHGEGPPAAALAALSGGSTSSPDGSSSSFPSGPKPPAKPPQQQQPKPQQPHQQTPPSGSGGGFQQCGKRGGKRYNKDAGNKDGGSQGAPGGTAPELPPSGASYYNP